MKKEIKKKIERELAIAIATVLEKYQHKAVSKTKKAVKESSKMVAKKFVKVVKTLEKTGKSKARPATSKSRKKVTIARTVRHRISAPQISLKETEHLPDSASMVKPEGNIPENI